MSDKKSVDPEALPQSDKPRHNSTSYNQQRVQSQVEPEQYPKEDREAGSLVRKKP